MSLFSAHFGTDERQRVREFWQREKGWRRWRVITNKSVCDGWVKPKETIDVDSGHVPVRASAAEVIHDLARSKNMVKSTRLTSKPGRPIRHSLTSRLVDTSREDSLGEERNKVALGFVRLHRILSNLVDRRDE